MKKILKGITVLPILMLLLLIGFTVPKVHAQVGVSVSFQTFYDDLSPYGQWVSDPGYGNVWVPNAETGFRPYCTGGHWVETEYGNTWVSDYPWGWAAFHYGRWTYDSYYGWVWIPGSDWAPAWVSWRYGGSSCGWAPLGPGVTVSASVGWHCPDDWWVFVGPSYLYSPNPYRYWRGPSYNRTYINQTTIINNTYIDNRTRVTYNYGPRPSQIQAVTHRTVPVYRLNAVNAPGSSRIANNTLNIYRPVVNKNTIRTSHPSAIRAPRPISRQLQSAATNKVPPFRQVLQKQTSANRPIPQQNNQRISRPAPQGGTPQHANVRQQQYQPQRNNQLPARTQQQHMQAPQQRPQHMTQREQHMQAPQERPQPMPQRQPHMQQAPQERPPMQQRTQPMPPPHMAPPRPMPEARPQPMPQQHMQPPAPPREEGGRR